MLATEVSSLCRFAAARYLRKSRLLPTSRWVSSTRSTRSSMEMTESSLATATTVAGSSSIPRPTSRQLYIVAMQAAIPMVGFGFMDNFLMLWFGEAIDCTLGAAFCLSTLAAAGLGNTLSDLAGVVTGDFLEAIAARVSLPQHALTAAQRSLKLTRYWSALGGCVGITIGCLLGMCCLPFMDTDKADKAKQSKELQTIFQSTMEDAHQVVHAERATLWIYDAKTNALWSSVAMGTKGIIRVAADSGLVGACVMSKQAINVPDAYPDARFNQSVDQKTGYRTRSVVVVPILNKQQQVVGAVQMINKDMTQDGGVFTASDEKILRLLATHVETFIRSVTKGKCTSASELLST